VRVLVVDDEPLAVDWLMQGLSGQSDVEIVGSAGDGDTALMKIRDLKPDLVLLDVQMPGATGTDIARTLRGEGPEVVFVTAFSEFAAEAFDMEAADYLLKPVRHDRLVEALGRARRRREIHWTHQRLVALEARLLEVTGVRATAGGYPEAFWIAQRDGRVRVLAADIRRIEADKDYALIHTSTRTFIQRVTMRELEQRLNPREVLRVHRGAFVRLSCVSKVERGARGSLRLHMEDGAEVDVGASYAARVTEALDLD
jgi:DNA-binding LytR/AlgR family response regulator